MIKISFITTLYYGKKYLKHLIQQAERNTLLFKEEKAVVYIEYIFVNDSPTEKIQAKFIESTILNKVKLISNESNVGIHQSRINGLEKADGEYIHFIDQDEIIKDEFLICMIRKIRKADIVVCNGYHRTNQKLKPIYKTYIALFMTRFKRIYVYGTDMIFSPGQCLIRKKAIPNIWRESQLLSNGCDDFYLWLSYFAKNNKIKCVNKKLYIHVNNNENFSNNKNKMCDSLYQLIILLEKNKLLNSKEISILKARYDIKSKNKKLKILIVNPEIAFWTFIYKVTGYY